MHDKTSTAIVLSDGLISLRPYRMSDTDNLYRAVRESLADLSPWLPFAHDGYSAKESRAWIKQRPGEWKKGIAYQFAIFEAKDDCTWAAAASCIDYNNMLANLGYWVRTSRMGKGTAPAAARLLAGWGIKELGLKRIEIVVATGNLRSQRAAEKAGAKREGVLRNRVQVHDKTYDAVMFSWQHDFVIAAERQSL
jgi:RimJ/RimL family protein N-acetyltransferase